MRSIPQWPDLPRKLGKSDHLRIDLMSDLPPIHVVSNRILLSSWFHMNHSVSQSIEISLCLLDLIRHYVADRINVTGYYDTYNITTRKVTVGSGPNINQF